MRSITIALLITLSACGSVHLEKVKSLPPECVSYAAELNAVNAKKSEMTHEEAQAAKTTLENSPNRKACYADPSI